MMVDNKGGGGSNNYLIGLNGNVIGNEVMDPRLCCQAEAPSIRCARMTQSLNDFLAKAWVVNEEFCPPDMSQL